MKMLAGAHSHREPAGHYELFREGTYPQQLERGLNSTLRLLPNSKRYWSARDHSKVEYGGPFGRKVWRF